MVDAPGMMHAATTESAATSASETSAASTTAGEGIIQGCAKQHERRKKCQSIPHDFSPYYLVPMLFDRTECASSHMPSKRISKSTPLATPAR
jgi:hypothetical protein